MDPAPAIGLLWLAFAATHGGFSSLRLRPRLVTLLGERLFQALYSLVALAIFIPLVIVYFGNKQAGPLLWAVTLGPVLTWTVYVLMGVAFVFVVASLANPSPASVVPGDPTPRGIYRITRHPLLMGIALFGGVHLLPSGVLSDVVFFGGFVVFSPIGAWHQDRRKLAADPASFADFHSRTPFIPFTGRETVSGLRELSPIVLVIGVGLTILLRWFHGPLFG